MVTTEFEKSCTLCFDPSHVNAGLVKLCFRAFSVKCHNLEHLHICINMLTLFLIVKLNILLTFHVDNERKHFIIKNEFQEEIYLDNKGI